MNVLKSARCLLRIGYVMLTPLLMLGLWGCAGRTSASIPAASTPAQTSTGKATSEAFRFGNPVESKSRALLAAQAGLKSAFHYVEPLTAVAVQQTTYGQYSRRMGSRSDRPADLKIWLVVYHDNKWQSIPPRPDITASPPFQGCVLVVINANDGLPLEIGGPLDAGRVAGCGQ